MTLANATTSDTLPTIEARLLSLEKTVGVNSKSSEPTSIKDVETRLNILLSNHTFQSHDGNIKTLNNDLKECDRLERQLDPGSILSHQGASSSGNSTMGIPILYRRQEILSSIDFIKEAMDHLTRIRELLLISYSSSDQSGDDKKHFTNAPIITSDRYEYACDKSVQRRLDNVASRVSGLNTRAKEMADRVDLLLNRYHKIVLAASEKIVLINEELSSVEAKRLKVDE